MTSHCLGSKHILHYNIICVSWLLHFLLFNSLFSLFLLLCVLLSTKTPRRTPRMWKLAWQVYGAVSWPRHGAQPGCARLPAHLSWTLTHADGAHHDNSVDFDGAEDRQAATVSNAPLQLSPAAANGREGRTGPARGVVYLRVTRLGRLKKSKHASSCLLWTSASSRGTEIEKVWQKGRFW